jgi:hypothetical protein
VVGLWFETSRPQRDDARRRAVDAARRRAVDAAGLLERIARAWGQQLPATLFRAGMKERPGEPLPFI